MGIIGTIRNWRWKKAVLALAIAFSVAKAGRSYAKVSPKTKAAEVEIEEVAEKIKEHKLLTEKEEQEFPNKIVKFIKLLAVDVIADLKVGKLEDASKEYRTMINSLEALVIVGKRSHVHEVRKSFAAVEAEIEELLKDKDNSKNVTLEDLPLGEWVFRSKHFFLYIKVVVKGGKKYVFVEKGGFPLGKGEWKKASKGKPEEIVNYVITKILKVKDPKILE